MYIKLINKNAEIFIPDNSPTGNALERTNYLAISAHQDDIEFMAMDGILKCYQNKDLWFTGVVTTNGQGSPRSGIYSYCSDEEMIRIRNQEQKKAAIVGMYSAQIFLNYTSTEVKDKKNKSVTEDLVEILKHTKPEIIYTHNPFDKHDTHIATFMKVIYALRELYTIYRPVKIYGCEVWRGLDWINDDEKITFDLSRQENLQASLLGIYDSQISGGKRYDLAVIGRMRSNATFFNSHKTDHCNFLSYAIDLTPLLEPQVDIVKYLQGYINRFSDNLIRNINKFCV